jgi:CheY-like chemotaxis protein
MTAPPAILMIDDNQGDVDLVRFAFEESRFPVRLVVAHDGHTGREWLHQHAAGALAPFQLVLLDLHMPRMDGRQLLLWIGQQQGLAHLPVVVMTSSDAPRDRQDCLEAGARAFHVKPATFDGFVALARELRLLLPAEDGSGPG